MVDLAKAPDESLSTYMQRITGLHQRVQGTLAHCKRENAELWDALDNTQQNFLDFAEQAEREKKLHPVLMTVAYQTVTSICSYVEESYVDGKPYIALPVALITALGAAMAYLSGNGRAGDLLTATANGAVGVLNVRYSSRKGDEAKRAREAKKATEQAKS